MAALLGASVPVGSALAAPLAPAPSSQPPPGSLAASRAAEHAARIAAIREAHTAASAARRAAHFAAAETAAQAEWQRTGKPAQLIVVRPRVIDVVTNGHLTSRIRRGAGPISLQDLAVFLPPGWLWTSGDTAMLSATMGLTEGATLDPGVANLRLAGGSDASSAASIWVGRGSLALRNISVTSWDPGSQQAIPVSAPGRPFITVGSGGHLDATDARVSDLGVNAGPAAGHDHTGVAFGPGSTGTLVRTRLARNLVGLKLSGSQNVRLQGVTVEQSHGDGLVLHDDHGTTLQAVDVSNNGRNGVLVTGTVPGRVLSGVTALGNGAFGAAVIRQKEQQVIGLSTSENKLGGLRLTGCVACKVMGTSAANEPIGLLVNGPASQITVEDAKVRGAGQGVVLRHGVSEVNIRAVDVDQAVVGVAVSAAGVRLRDIAVNNSVTAVKISTTAARVIVSDPTITAGRDGIVVADGAREVILRNVVTHDVGHDAVVVSSPGVVISGGKLDGGRTGINARAPITIQGTSVSRVVEGIHVAPGVTVHGDRIDVLASHSGIKVDQGGEFILTDSRVRAPDALRGRVVARGNNTVSPPPFPWLGGVGVILVVVAVLLEVLRSMLQWRSSRRGRLPPSRRGPVRVGP
jgi:hypothetical protein